MAKYGSFKSVATKLGTLAMLACVGTVIWWLVRTYAPGGLSSASSSSSPGLALTGMTTSTSASDTKQVLNCTLHKQVSELKDVSTVLNRPVKEAQPKKHNPVAYVPCTQLNAQLLWGPGDPESTEYVLSNKNPEAPLSGGDDLFEPTGEEVSLVEKAQPTFIKNGPAFAKRAMDGEGKRYLFYFDREFPEQPVNVEFLKNREKFVKERQFEYPSIVASSRMYDLLKPNVATCSLDLTSIVDVDDVPNDATCGAGH
jgi:hypothetical protein